MEFSWNDEQQQLKKSVIEFARRELPEGPTDRDGVQQFDRSRWEACCAFGLTGLPFPASYGGEGVDILGTVLAMEGLGYGCRDGGLLFGLNAQMWSVQMPILQYGTEEQKADLLPLLCSGKKIGAHGMTEPGSGSDAFSLTTTATRSGDEYVLNGSKTFVSLAPVADLFVVFATVNRLDGFMGVTAFLVERDSPGFSIGKPIGKMGLQSCPWAELFFEDCAIPVTNRLGPEGGGATLFHESMEWERGCLLACSVGAMERQLEQCIVYAKSRRQFGTPIGKFQSISDRITQMKLRLETSRLLLYRLAWQKSLGKKAPLDSAMVKLHVSESWKQSSLDAIQIHGGYGYTTEYGVERDLRDAIGGTLYSGTTEIQRTIIADALGL